MNSIEITIGTKFLHPQHGIGEVVSYDSATGWVNVKMLNGITGQHSAQQVAFMIQRYWKTLENE